MPSDEKERGTPTTPVAPDAPENTPLLDHERLDVFKVALEFAAMVPALTKAARPALRDQLERASASIALNLAEGNSRRTQRDRHHFFSMAQGCWTSPLCGLVHLTGPSALASATLCAALDGGRLCPRPVGVGVRDGAPRHRGRHPREAQAHPHRADARWPASEPLNLLPDHPRFVFCATDMAFGASFIFDRDRVGSYLAGYAPHTGP